MLIKNENGTPTRKRRQTAGHALIFFLYTDPKKAAVASRGTQQVP